MRAIWRMMCLSEDLLKWNNITTLSLSQISSAGTLSWYHVFIFFKTEISVIYSRPANGHSWFINNRTYLIPNWTLQVRISAILYPIVGSQAAVTFYLELNSWLHKLLDWAWTLCAYIVCPSIRGAPVFFWTLLFFRCLHTFLGWTALMRQG